MIKPGLLSAASDPAAGTAILAYIPSPAQGVWHLGPIPLRAYALFIIIGIVVAISWGERRWVARGGLPGTVVDVAVWAVPFGLIGGRIYHVLTDWPVYFGAGGDPMRAFAIWNGGLGIWGAVIFGGIGAWIACRRRGIPLPAFGDAVGPPILLAQAIGRIGNYFNQELYGPPTQLPWGLEIFVREDAAGREDPFNGVSTGEVLQVVHPTFLYELLWNLLIVVLLVVIDRRTRIGHGRLFALYVAGYCVGRFMIELIRQDPATEIFGVRINSYTSAIVFLLASAYVLFAPKGREDPSTLVGNQPVESAEAKVPAGVGAAVSGAPSAESSAGTATSGSSARAATATVTSGDDTSAADVSSEKPSSEKPSSEKTQTKNAPSAKAPAEKTASGTSDPAEKTSTAEKTPTGEKTSTAETSATTAESARPDKGTDTDTSGSATDD